MKAGAQSPTKFAHSAFLVLAAIVIEAATEANAKFKYTIEGTFAVCRSIKEVTLPSCLDWSPVAMTSLARSAVPTLFSFFKILFMRAARAEPIREVACHLIARFLPSSSRLGLEIDDPLLYTYRPNRPLPLRPPYPPDTACSCTDRPASVRFRFMQNFMIQVTSGSDGGVAWGIWIVPLRRVF